MNATYLLLLIAAMVGLVVSQDADNVGFPKKKPIEFEKAATARWLAHQNTMGAVATISVHLNGLPFVQSKSFVDGMKNNSTGDLYFYDSPMDATTTDFLADPDVSFALTEATLTGHCNDQFRDPESPVCARVVFNGKMGEVTNAEEIKFATEALFERHPTMANWPHDFLVYKIAISNIWLIDIYGGASTIEIDDYYSAKVRY